MAQARIATGAADAGDRTRMRGLGRVRGFCAGFTSSVRTCVKLFDRFSRTARKFYFGISVGLLLFLPGVAAAYSSPGNPTGYVNDFAKVLKPETVQLLNAELSAFEASTTNQIAVVTIPNMGGDYIEHYAPELFREWGIGTEKNDNGILLLIAIEEREVRIEVGYGLEGALPDSIAQSIINQRLVPSFKAGDYDSGVVAAVRDIALATQNEYTGGGSTKKLPIQAYEAIIFFAFIALQWIGAVLARSKSWWAGGIVGGVIGTAVWVWFGMFVLWGGLLTGGLVGLGLLLDYVISKKFDASKHTGASIPWWAGGGMGGRGGGGFGGFGGGMSGGGGASGRW